MPVLTDTNIFLRLLQPHHPHCRLAERALDTLRSRDEVLCVTSQKLMELWAVATGPFADNGLGLTTGQAASEIDQIKHFRTLLPEVAVFEEWERLVKLHQVSGKNTHDARLVAAMHLQGIDKILTFNAKDFARYGNITILDPANFE